MRESILCLHSSASSGRQWDGFAAPLSARFDVLAQRLEAAGVNGVRTRTVVHRIAATHPYARLPLAFCDSLTPLWRAAGMAGEGELIALRAALEGGLAGAHAAVTTFTLVQSWGTR
jgi:hypothetical protein